MITKCFRFPEKWMNEKSHCKNFHPMAFFHQNMNLLHVRLWIIYNLDIWVIVSYVTLNMVLEKTPRIDVKIRQTLWRFYDVVLRTMFICHLKIVITFVFLQNLFMLLFVICLEYVKSNKTTCLLSFAFTLSPRIYHTIPVLLTGRTYIYMPLCYRTL